MKKICLIASSGGHLEELNQLKDVINNYNCYYVVTDTESTRKNPKYQYLIQDFNRKNRFLYFLRLFKMFYEQFRIFCQEKPDIILTTGAGLVIPTCIFAKIFKKKVIFIESFARMHDLSKTGKFLYNKADLFIVQWQEIADKYENAIYGGGIF